VGEDFRSIVSSVKSMDKERKEKAMHSGDSPRLPSEGSDVSLIENNLLGTDDDEINTFKRR
jgi:hypothetical protein